MVNSDQIGFLATILKPSSASQKIVVERSLSHSHFAH
jgi:hypothetical protein